MRVACSVLLLVIGFGRAVAQAPAASQVDKIFEKWDKPNSPGCALSVIQNGRIVYKHGYGMADLDHDVPITPTVFHVASVSKQFTAASIVLLALEGKLSFDDPVRKHIPELPDFGTPITIRHLLHHTSGLRDQWELLGLAGWRYSLDLITDDDVLALISRQKTLNFKPGEKHLYCNTGYTLLAQIVKRVSGQSFREFTNARLFQPLGMKSTHFRDNHAEIVKRQAYGYSSPLEGFFLLSVTNFDTVGATSLLTTVEDLALWDENFYEQKVGGAALIGQLQQRGKLNSGELLDYAFGLTLSKYKGLSIVDHGGSDAGYRADLIRFPDQHFSVACLCNTTVNPGQLARQVADLYLAREIKPPPALRAEKTVELSEQQLAARVGVYWNPDGDSVRRIILTTGRLRIATGSGPGTEMKPLSESRFRLADAPVELGFEASGKLIEFPDGGKPETFELTPAFAPTAAQMAAYTGAYTSSEIEAIFRVKLDGSTLEIHRLKFGPVKLQPAVKDVFTSSLGRVRFTRDARNRVTGLVLNGGRIRNFRLDRMS